MRAAARAQMSLQAATPCFALSFTLLSGLALKFALLEVCTNSCVALAAHGGLAWGGRRAGGWAAAV